jgi:hypothetical protein
VNDCTGNVVCTLAGSCAPAPNVVSSHETFLGCSMGRDRARDWPSVVALALLGLIVARRRRAGACAP